jgi:hypothetical protein
LETDATPRAKKLAVDSGLLARHEEPGFDHVLSALPGLGGLGLRQR